MTQPDFISRSITRLSDTRSDLAECPTWDGRSQTLYWCDILGKQLIARDWASGTETIRALPDVIGSFGLTMDPGTLIVALRDSVGLLDLASGDIAALVSIEADDPRTRLNDGKVGPDGAFWVGTMDDRPDRKPIGALYRIDAGGGCTRVIEEVTVSNGLAWSPDNKTLYHADSRPGRIETWDFDVASGTISNRHPFAQMTNESGRPDGGTMDAEGHYWSAGVSAGVVNRFAPDGTLTETLAMPVPRPTMPCFCGPDLDTLVITSLRPLADAQMLADYPDSGLVFSLSPGVSGLPGHLFRL
ncbi:SMP-30/gluconolactonase/LRE family protein [Stappia sp. ES.058]|uniref:SMP-30/gluconolactonase/LRE family protein n=1 Tax=Stappia sp. ES.058 TaxID=1881061 RepID=UPI00087CB930|nr:SMP-30/gluconolactonase/LRE family protein [Stappia sp. ES.058]SDU25909.1 Sugar lactone lactonase YvrE [Stappia sp. ES.058]